MAGISKRTWIFVMATGGITPLVQATETPPVHYAVGLDVENNEVEAITVRATVRTGADGSIDFTPPSQRPTDVHAERGSLDTSDAGTWHVTSAPDTDIVLAWRSPKPDPRPSLVGSAWHSVVAQPGKVFAFGGVLLALPKGPATRSATVTMSLPTGWRGASDIGSAASTVENIPYASFVASRDLYEASRPMGKNTLHVASTGARTQDVDKIATLLATTLMALRHEAADRAANDAADQPDPKDVALNLVIFNEGEGYGFNTAGSTATLLLSQYDSSHPWLFSLLGYLATADDTSGGARNAWFTRGFIGYRVANALRANGVFDNTSFARHIDETLGAYGGSPLRRAPNAQVAQDYDQIREMHDLPASRGELFAWLIDARIREVTHGQKRLSDALQTMNPASPDPGPALIAAVAAEGGGDIGPLYRRYIVDGELLQLPADALGPCFSIGTVVYDYGWQQQHVFAKPNSLCVGADSSAMPDRVADPSPMNRLPHGANRR